MMKRKYRHLLRVIYGGQLPLTHAYTVQCTAIERVAAMLGHTGTCAVKGSAHLWGMCLPQLL